MGGDKYFDREGAVCFSQHANRDEEGGGVGTATDGYESVGFGGVGNQVRVLWQNF